MKKNHLFLLIVFVFGFSFLGFSQEEAAAADAEAAVEKKWAFTNNISLGFNQASFTNWKAGGDNSIAGLGNFKSQLNYTAGANSWLNSLELAYGLSKIDDGKTKKTDDKIEFNSTYNHELSAHWAMSGLFKFSTQFANGYDKEVDTIVLSKFMVPANFLLTPGLTYHNSSKTLTAFISPVAANAVYVADTLFSASHSIEPGKHWLFGFGAAARIEYNQTIMENVKLSTKVDLFMDYLDECKTSVLWDFRIDLKVNKFLTTSLATGLIYDPKTIFTEVNAETGEVTNSRKVQFKEVFMLNFTYSF